MKTTTMDRPRKPRRPRRSPPGGLEYPLDAPGAPADGEGERERVSVLRAVRRHWVLACAPAAILVALAMVAGIFRTPVYTSEARLNVGRIDVTSQAIPGFVAGTQSLAATYSRAVDATDVVGPVAEKLGVPTGAVAGRVSAAPIPDSSLFRVQATGSSPADAADLANLVTDSLITYIGRVNNASPDGERLLKEIADASVSLAKARSGRRAAVRTYAESPSAAKNARVTEAEATEYAAKIRLQTLSDAYRSSQQGVAQSQFVQVLNPASAAFSDRRSVLQRYVFLAIVGGIAIGLALATARANLFPRPTAS